MAIHDEELRNLNDTSTFLSAEWPDFRRSSAHSTLESLNESYNALKEEVEGKQRRLKGHQERGQAWRARMSGVLVLLANAEKLDEASVHEGCEMAALQIQMANLMVIGIGIPCHVVMHDFFVSVEFAAASFGARKRSGRGESYGERVSETPVGGSQ